MIILGGGAMVIFLSSSLHTVHKFVFHDKRVLFLQTIIINKAIFLLKGKGCGSYE
jgi:hypothetical protein